MPGRIEPLDVAALFLFVDLEQRPPIKLVPNAGALDFAQLKDGINRLTAQREIRIGERAAPHPSIHRCSGI
jgi:hypothetical protein